MGRVKYDKFLGRIREKDSATSSTGTPPGNFATWDEYITWLITQNFPLPADFNTWEEFLNWLTLNNLTLPGDYTTWEDYVNYLISIALPVPTEFTTWQEFLNWLTLNNFPPPNFTTWEDYISWYVSVNTELPAEFNTWEDYINFLIDQAAGTDTTTRRISGSVVWLQNLDFQVNPLVYQILGKRVESPENLVTIPANVSADPVFAVIYGDIFGNTGYILGTPAPSPAIPAVDDSTQIVLTPGIYIPGLGTEPGTDPNGTPIVTEQVYDENIEWATAKVEDANNTIDFVSILSPSKNTKHIRIGFAEPAGGGLTAGRLVQSSLSVHKDVSVLVEANDFTFLLTDLSQYHKTDTLIGLERKLSWFNWQNLNAINVYLINKADNSTIQLKANNTFTKETWAVAELNFSVKIPLNFIAAPLFAPVPVGEYVIIIEGLTSYDQYFIEAAGETFSPVNCQLSFTRTAPIQTENGNILLSLQSSSNLLANSGLLLDLYNGAVKIGTFTLLPGYFGWNPGRTDYQRLTIPVNSFNPSGNVITKLVIKPVNQWPNNSTFDIDDVVLQTGLNANTNPLQTEIIEDLTFDYRNAALNNAYEIDPIASFSYKIVEAVVITDAGTVTAEVAINATPVTGLGAIAATTARTVTPATAANLVTAGDVVKLTISALATATAINGKLRIIRT